MEQKFATHRHKSGRQKCNRSHRHTYNYRVCSYTWSVPYTRRYFSHTRLRLHSKTTD